MRWRARTLALAALAPAALLAGSTSSSAASSLSFIACPEAGGSGFECSALQVPLERSGAVPGTLTLTVERKLAGKAPSQDAVVALAGGPGQAALPLSPFIATAIAPALGSRDLLVFDQRGTGTSDPLSCPALEVASDAPAPTLFGRCAGEIGPARGAYTTQESVEDIEALRVAGGYEKLVLYGTSYGTKVALEYAERHPQDVQALVLDSVVPSSGWEPLHVESFQAIPGILAELCADDACAGITDDALADMARLVARLQKQVLSGSVYDGSGRRHSLTMDVQGLLDVLEAGDLNPALRALLPAAVVSALHDDPDPLLRLQALSEGLVPSVPLERSGEAAPEVDEALFAATICEESPFPWSRGAPAATRLHEAIAFTNAQPPSVFHPFDASAAFEDSLMRECADWPDASPPPPAPGPLPNVPTLILSGEQDMRTPTSAARSVAAQIPDAQLLVVPFTGHSVLGSDLSDCSALAVQDFFASVPVKPCADAPDQFPPTPVTPTRLAAIHPPHGLSGRPGRTAVAVLDTLVDLNRQVIAATLQADAELPSGSSFGGLRGGYAKLTRKTATLKDFSFVPGVQLLATFPIRDGRLQSASITISGSQAAAGTVRFGGSSTRLVGTLGGRQFDLDVAKVTLARAGAREWPALAAIDGRLERLRLAASAGGQPFSQLP
jgi:pimeloyl-ACP methyl ester carboxylesterase